MRRKLYIFLRRKIFKVPDHCHPPKYLYWIKCFLFPLDTYVERQMRVNYWIESGTWIINGNKYKAYDLKLLTEIANNDLIDSIEIYVDHVKLTVNKGKL